MDAFTTTVSTCRWIGLEIQHDEFQGRGSGACLLAILLIEINDFQQRWSIIDVSAIDRDLEDETPF